MKVNSSTVLVTDKVILIPYLHHHVEKYHRWMTDEDLLTLTGSEPLSLKQEYEMQQTWLNDENKCTFIVLDRDTYITTQDEISAMIGDVNVFISPDDNEAKTGEISIMIAEKEFRKQGRGRSVVEAMLSYCVQHLCIRTFECKIGYENKPSLELFKKCNFKCVSQSDVFEEHTLRLHIDESVLLSINRVSLVIKTYEKNSAYVL